MQIEAFTTDRLPSNLSLLGWQSQRLSSRGFTITPRGREAFRASLRTCALRRYGLAEVSISSHTLASRPTPPTAARPNRYLLSLVAEGTVHVLQDGRDAVVATGDIFLVDTSRPLCVEATALRVKSVDISATYMHEILPEVDGLTAIRISDQTPAGMILKTTVEKLFALPADTHEQAAEHIADAIPHLLASEFAALPAAKRTIPPRSEAYHRQRVLEFILLRLQDRNLSPRMIAKSLDLSPRYLHKLFAGEPATLMHHVWNERLNRCRSELAAPLLARRSITEIAYQWGFCDAAHFSRVFSVRFGESPSAFRRKAVNKSARN